MNSDKLRDKIINSEVPVRVEFFAEGIDDEMFGEAQMFSGGEISFVADAYENTVCGRFFLEREDAEAWRIFIVESSKGLHTYEQVPLPHVTKFRFIETKPQYAIPKSELEKFRDEKPEFTAQNLGKFLSIFFAKDQAMRLGQAAVFVFGDKVSKELEDRIFYAEDLKFVGEELWKALF